MSDKDFKYFYDWLDRITEGLDEATNAKEKQPEVDLEQVGKDRKLMANAYNRPIIYGYFGSNHHGGTRYYEISPIVCEFKDDLERYTKMVMNKYHPKGSVLVAYPSRPLDYDEKNFKNKDLGESYVDKADKYCLERRAKYAEKTIKPGVAGNFQWGGGISEELTEDVELDEGRFTRAVSKAAGKIGDAVKGVANKIDTHFDDKNISSAGKEIDSFNFFNKFLVKCQVEKINKQYNFYTEDGDFILASNIAKIFSEGTSTLRDLAARPKVESKDVKELPADEAAKNIKGIAYIYGIKNGKETNDCIVNYENGKIGKINNIDKLIKTLRKKNGEDEYVDKEEPKSTDNGSDNNLITKFIECVKKNGLSTYTVKIYNKGTDTTTKVPDFPQFMAYALKNLVPALRWVRDVSTKYPSVDIGLCVSRKNVNSSDPDNIPGGELIGKFNNGKALVNMKEQINKYIDKYSSTNGTTINPTTNNHKN